MKYIIPAIFLLIILRATYFYVYRYTKHGYSYKGFKEKHVVYMIYYAYSRVCAILLCLLIFQEILKYLKTV